MKTPQPKKTTLHLFHTLEYHPKKKCLLSKLSITDPSLNKLKDVKQLKLKASNSWEKSKIAVYTSKGVQPTMIIINKSWTIKCSNLSMVFEHLCKIMHMKILVRNLSQLQIFSVSPTSLLLKLGRTLLSDADITVNCKSEDTAESLKFPSFPSRFITFIQSLHASPTHQHHTHA
eukprot:GHVL01033013.1.p1 GENE.GHVL01033013.1~~GHVL01033013.1.p1  ORF type:complete len:174 (+),score=5.29 GHVL01033013.1:588-1109(+)